MRASTKDVTDMLACFVEMRDNVTSILEAG